jgi:hypothetical protein
MAREFSRGSRGMACELFGEARVEWPVSFREARAEWPVMPGMPAWGCTAACEARAEQYNSPRGLR